MDQWTRRSVFVYYFRVPIVGGDGLCWSVSPPPHRLYQTETATTLPHSSCVLPSAHVVRALSPDERSKSVSHWQVPCSRTSEWRTRSCRVDLDDMDFDPDMDPDMDWETGASGHGKRRKMS